MNALVSLWNCAWAGSQVMFKGDGKHDYVPIADEIQAKPLWVCTNVWMIILVMVMI